MTSNEQIRPIIDCFCQILSLYGFSSMTVEHFLAAKFDQKTITSTFWRLIYEMICFDDKNFVQNKFEPIHQTRIVKKIKDNLYERGYTYEQFMLLDETMSDGSQQLLVCFGWLIYQMKFIEKSMRMYLHSIANIDQVERLDHCTKTDLLNEIEQTIESNRKICIRLEQIEHDEINQMSTFEKQLCEYPHLISQYLIELKKESFELNLFVFWNKYENIFWKWMESVLDQPISNGDSCQYLEAEKEKFNAAIDTLDNVLIRLEQLCLSTDRLSIENDVSSIILSIDSQISSLFKQLLNSQ